MGYDRQAAEFVIDLRPGHGTDIVPQDAVLQRYVAATVIGYASAILSRIAG